MHWVSIYGKLLNLDMCIKNYLLEKDGAVASDTSNVTGRFEKILSGKDMYLPIYDQAILQTEGFVVVPTLGSILPYWFLIIPRFQVLNFVELSRNKTISPDRLGSL